MAEKRSNKVLGPQILWDAATREIEIRLPPMHKTGPAIETGWRQEIIYVVRIRESGTKPWSVGFETPWRVALMG